MLRVNFAFVNRKESKMPEKEKNRTKEDDRNISANETLKKEEGNTSEETKERKKARRIECLSNLTALHKVQGAILTQMERNID